MKLLTALPWNVVRAGIDDVIGLDQGRAAAASNSQVQEMLIKCKLRCIEAWQAALGQLDTPPRLQDKEDKSLLVPFLDFAGLLHILRAGIMPDGNPATTPDHVILAASHRLLALDAALPGMQGMMSRPAADLLLSSIERQDPWLVRVNPSEYGEGLILSAGRGGGAGMKTVSGEYPCPLAAAALVTGIGLDGGSGMVRG